MVFKRGLPGVLWAHASGVVRGGCVDLLIADCTRLHAQRLGLLAERAFDVHFCWMKRGEKIKLALRFVFSSKIFNSENFQIPQDSSLPNEFSWVFTFDQISKWHSLSINQISMLDSRTSFTINDRCANCSCLISIAYDQKRLRVLKSLFLINLRSLKDSIIKTL